MNQTVDGQYLQLVVLELFQPLLRQTLVNQSLLKMTHLDLN